MSFKSVFKKAAAATAIAVVTGGVLGLAGTTAATAAPTAAKTAAVGLGDLGFGSVLGDTYIQGGLTGTPDLGCTYEVLWGDGTRSVIGNAGDTLRHDYAKAGSYDLRTQKVCESGNPNLGSANSGAFIAKVGIGKGAGTAKTTIVANATLPKSASGYFFLQAGNGQALGGASGAQPTLAARDNKRTDQQWKIVADKHGGYQLINRKTGQALDVADGSAKAGGKIVQWASHGSANQSWTIRGINGFGFQIINNNSVKTLDANTTNTGAGAIQNPLALPTGTFPGGINTQTWQLTPAP